MDLATRPTPRCPTAARARGTVDRASSTRGPGAPAWRQREQPRPLPSTGCSLPGWTSTGSRDPREPLAAPLGATRYSAALPPGRDGRRRSGCWNHAQTTVVAGGRALLSCMGSEKRGWHAATVPLAGETGSCGSECQGSHSSTDYRQGALALPPIEVPAPARRRPREPISAPTAPGWADPLFTDGPKQIPR